MDRRLRLGRFNPIGRRQDKTLPAVWAGCQLLTPPAYAPGIAPREFGPWWRGLLTTVLNCLAYCILSPRLNYYLPPPRPLFKSRRWAVMDETILSILPGSSDHDRVVVVHRRGFGVNDVVLRHESFSEAIGWFEQNAVELSTCQVGQLKQALGVIPSSAVRRRSGCGPCPRLADASDQPVSLRFVAQNVG